MAVDNEPGGSIMGHTAFLIGPHGSAPSNLPEAIGNLEDASLVFMSRWNKGDLQRAGDVSKQAMPLFDFIANELLRVEVDRKGSKNYDGTSFATEMASSCGQGVTGATVADQLSMMQAGPGNGQLPGHLRPVSSLSLRQLLNKVKHRNPGLMNFRINAGEHIFVICADHTGGGSEGVYEFIVAEFCNRCRAAAAAL